VVGVTALDAESEAGLSSCHAVYAAAPPTPAPPPTRREAATRDPAKTTRRLRRDAGGGLAGPVGEGCPAYGRHVGGVSGEGGSGAVLPVSVTIPTVPNRSVTMLRPRWVSAKNLDGLIRPLSVVGCHGHNPP
jgi:hypothetical protein